MKDRTHRTVVDAIDFRQLVRFPSILRAVTLSLQPPRLLVGLLMITLLLAVGKTWDNTFDEPTIHPRGLLATGALYDDQQAQDLLQTMLRPYRERTALWPEGAERPPRLDAREVRTEVERLYRADRAEAVAAELGDAVIGQNDQDFLRRISQIESVRPRGAFEALAQQSTSSLIRVVQGVITLAPFEIFDAFADMFVRTPRALWSQKPVFTSLFGVLLLIVVSIGGGALCRMAACEVAGREKLSSFEACNFAFTAWIRLLLTPALPLLIAGFLALVLMAMGVVTMWLPFVDAIGGLLYGVALLLGFLIAFVLLGYAACFPMVIPAVAVENCGPADAFQRAMTYLLSRPLHFFGYGVVAVIGLALGYMLVALVAVTTLNATAATVGAFPNNTAIAIAGNFEIFNLQPRQAEFHSGWSTRFAASMVTFWQLLILCLVGAYIFSYMAASATQVYMLMRRSVDGQDESEIWRHGLVPGTLSPLPTAPPVPKHGISGLVRDVAKKPDGKEDAGDDAASDKAARRADTMLSGAFKGALSLRLKSKEAAPATAARINPELTADEADETAEAELGPELIDPEDLPPEIRKNIDTQEEPESDDAADDPADTSSTTKPESKSEPKPEPKPQPEPADRVDPDQPDQPDEDEEDKSGKSTAASSSKSTASDNDDDERDEDGDEDTAASRKKTTRRKAKKKATRKSSARKKRGKSGGNTGRESSGD